MQTYRKYVWKICSVDCKWAYNREDESYVEYREQQECLENMFDKS